MAARVKLGSLEAQRTLISDEVSFLDNVYDEVMLKINSFDKNKLIAKTSELTGKLKEI